MRQLRGTLVIAATYVVFLLFAQFGFLEQARHELGSPRDVQGVMAFMGLAGLASSLVADAILARVAAARVVRAALVVSGLVALASLSCHSGGTLRIAASAIGASIGLLTVAVAAGLRDLVPGPNAGLLAGVATGAAYFVCNVPVLFAGSPGAKAILAGMACLGAAALVPRAEWTSRAELGAPMTRKPAAPPFAAVLATFVVLVALDAAAFAVIQATPQLQATTWGNGARTLVQGTIHLVVAIAAGALLDRGLLRGPLVATWCLFALAFPAILTGGGAAMAGGAIYAAGISIYSVALVVYPSSSASPRLPTRRRAALVYGIAGWLGSALGVGAAQELRTIPLAAVAGAGVVLAAVWFRPSRNGWSAAWRQFGGAAAGGMLLLAPVWIAHQLARPASSHTATADARSNARGRAVYIAEGCIHCHSQYVRPGTADEERWGPSRPLDRRQRPIVAGNRRQGPDLGAVGNRRSAVWQEAHLRDPRRLAPGSRMPSYAHLFADERGRDLVAYLDSLGAETSLERAATIALEPPATAPRPASIAHGGELFASYCAVCHGREGRGDGPLAPLVSLPAMNLRKGPLVLVRCAADGTPDRAELQRLIRHGVPPTAMPGHETMPAQDVADLAAYVAAVVPPSNARAAR